jgi:hypothetical protein
MTLTPGYKLLEDGIGGHDPGYGDNEAPPNGHVGQAPAP